MTTPEKWVAYKGHPVKQSNYGRYKTIVSRGTGATLINVGITGDTAEIVAEVANNAGVAGDLLEIARLFLRSIDYEILKCKSIGDAEGANLKLFTREQVVQAIAQAERLKP